MEDISISNKMICQLSVLGYSSKLFRDDEKAMEVDQGKHLISWMGDGNVVMIDRFDVRAFLSDNLQLVDPNTETKSLENEDIETLCEKERYRALFDFDGEEDVYLEEEFKRVNSYNNNAYNQVSYKYEQESFTNEPSSSPLSLPNESYIFSSKLDETTNTVLPISNKMKEIIEKTAACVHKHGKQMEIFIKARQTNNIKFDFLEKTNNLNPYYQFVLEDLKRKKYNEESNLKVDSNQHLTNPESKMLPRKESAPGMCVSDLDQLREVVNCPYKNLVGKIHNLKRLEGEFKNDRIDN